MLDILSKEFDRVVCVFMYIVKGLEYENRYIEWAEKKYSNCEFIQTPHYCLYSFIRHGYLGIKKDETIKTVQPQLIHDRMRRLIGLEWCGFGFKKIDGITRRSFLNGNTKKGYFPDRYAKGYNHESKDFYPLMDLKNADVLKYITDNNLINPFNYGTTKPSSGCDISTPQFLVYMREKYPEDLNKIFEQFPETEVKLFHYDNYIKG